MMRRLSRFDIEIVEQPIDAESVEALARVRARSPVAIAADLGVIALGDAFDVCRLHAADLIVVGLHETGGLLRFCKVAHIAEAANIDVCIHGLHETGITTVAASHVAAVTPNLDDGNQYMNNFLAWDIIAQPDLTLQERQRCPSPTGRDWASSWTGTPCAKRLRPGGRAPTGGSSATPAGSGSFRPAQPLRSNPRG